MANMYTMKQAAYEAGKRRMVPIFLTTATTAVGVVPVIIAQSSFWMPVGVTIFAGGIGSLILVVTMLPIIYWKVSTPCLSRMLRHCCSPNIHPAATERLSLAQ